MPEKEDKQLPKMFIRAASARKCSITHTGPRVHFPDEKQKTAADIFDTEVKLEPLKPRDDSRPVSRAKLDENTPKMKIDHFVRTFILSDFPFIYTHTTLVYNNIT